MRRNEIDNYLEGASFDYFYWFSRFEFALKENKYLKDKNVGAKAEPSWKEFQEKNKTDYIASKEASQFITLHPKRQIVSDNEELDWKPVGISHCNNDLCKIITMLNTVRESLIKSS